MFDKEYIVSKTKDGIKERELREKDEIMDIIDDKIYKSAIKGYFNVTIPVYKLKPRFFDSVNPDKIFECLKDLSDNGYKISVYYSQNIKTITTNPHPHTNINISWEE
ncbi:hypothetical protein LMHOCYYV_CDS0029 [Staphylococcus phage PG-2021_4]